MLIEPIPPLIKEAIIDTMFAAEIVDFLGITSEEIVELLADRITENLDEFKALLQMEDNDEEEESNY